MRFGEEFVKNGWFVFDMPNPDPIFEARDALANKLKQQWGQDVSLETYHEMGFTDEQHTQNQLQFTEFFRAARFGVKIVFAQKAFFQSLLGLDLFVQANPYLRMTRPLKPQDNIGYHRDTFYGGSPYELSVLIPFVDLPKESSLSVLTGSHILSEKHFPTQQILNPDKDVVKGSPKHQLGFLYAPKVMDGAIENQMEPIALKVGQGLVFSLALVHGSVVNKGPVTRWSIDTRVMNAFAPVNLSARPEYYTSLSASSVTLAAKEYFKANEEDSRDNVELAVRH